MEFSQFCSCGRSGYAYLKQCVDGCARQGRSYEFVRCRMPSGCRPVETTVGFWREDDTWYLYFRPAVDYYGRDPWLAAFFEDGSFQRFPSFQALVRRLQDLDPDAVELPKPGPMPDLFRRLSEALQGRVFGQDRAVEAVSFKLYSHVCKQAPNRPLSLIFYGPTCVGKSELAKEIAPVLNQLLEADRYQMVWTELNTFTEAHSVYRLTGAPPGYVGYDDQPVLEAVRRNPCTVFMFDELDKAHPEVLKVFMSILDEGRCAARKEDEEGHRELDFRRCIFLFTTNTDLSAGPPRRLGFALPEAPETSKAAEPSGPAGLAQRLFWENERARQALTRAGVLREIAGRFSGLIGFQPLSEEAKMAITAKQIRALGREYGLEIAQVDPAIAQALTPREALSLRSTAVILEGVLTPFFLSQSDSVLPGMAYRLAGTAEAPQLLPEREPAFSCSFLERKEPKEL